MKSGRRLEEELGGSASSLRREGGEVLAYGEGKDKQRGLEKNSQGVKGRELKKKRGNRGK